MRRSNRLLPHMLVLPLALLAVVCTAEFACGEVLFSHAGATYPSSDDGSPNEGWTRNKSGSSVTATALSPDPGYGLDAWKIDDPVTTHGHALNYTQEFTDQQISDALSKGWMLTVKLRVEDTDEELSSSVAAEAAFPAGNGVTSTAKRFALAFSVSGADTRVGVYDGNDFTTASGTVDGTGYHEFVMKYDPSDEKVDVFADGSTTPLISNAAGSVLDLNRVLWGANSSADKGTGYYNLVRFEIVPEPSTLMMLVGLLVALLPRFRRY